MIQIAPTNIDHDNSVRENGTSNAIGKGVGKGIGKAAPTAAHQEADAVSQLRAHLAQLEDLHGRLRFVMSDVSTVLKKKI